jgi:class 3 adenylate cyclase
MSNLYFSSFSLCCFCGTLAINAAFAYRAESASRTRYKTIHKITFTQARIQEILNTLMPAGVIDQLKSLKPEDPPPSHYYNSVTLSQSDLVGFTKLASTRTPAEVVEIIGKLFGRYDELTDKHRLCKVETVGDAYLAAQGSWPLTQTHSPFDVILFGLEVVQATTEFARQHRPPLPIGCRLGVDTGECVGGIVGCEMQRYHLFGALLHRVEFLESTAPEGQVQVGRSCRQAAELMELTNEDKCQWSFRFVERGGANLATSKGDAVAFEAVGGRPFLIAE